MTCKKQPPPLEGREKQSLAAKVQTSGHAPELQDRHQNALPWLAHASKTASFWEHWEQFWKLGNAESQHWRGVPNVPNVPNEFRGIRYRNKNSAAELRSSTHVRQVRCTADRANGLAKPQDRGHAAPPSTGVRRDRYGPPVVTPRHSRGGDDGGGRGYGHQCAPPIGTPTPSTRGGNSTPAPSLVAGFEVRFKAGFTKAVSV